MGKGGWLKTLEYRHMEGGGLCHMIFEGSPSSEVGRLGSFKYFSGCARVVSRTGLYGPDSGWTLRKVSGPKFRAY